MNNWPRAWGIPPVSAVLKAAVEDFRVDEELDVEFSGEGEHLWIWLEKRGRNTADVARELAVLAGVPAKAVSWSGLKDRQAVTRQWFSLQLPQNCEAETWQGEGWRVLEATRHRRKLRIGSHRSNRFGLVLRECQGDFEALEARLQQVAQSGVPNYFGEQRFGWGGANIDAARNWIENGAPRIGRQRRSLYLSAVRSWLFNRVLAQRVEDGHWNLRLPGDVMVLDGRGSIFQDDASAELDERLLRGEIHPTGPLCGRISGLLPTGLSADLEQSVLVSESRIVKGLEALGVDAGRRALRLLPRQLQWRWSADNVLELNFSLPAGCFATTLVREFAETVPG